MGTTVHNSRHTLQNPCKGVELAEVAMRGTWYIGSFDRILRIACTVGPLFCQAKSPAVATQAERLFNHETSHKTIYAYAFYDKDCSFPTTCKRSALEIKESQVNLIRTRIFLLRGESKRESSESREGLLWPDSPRGECETKVLL